MTTVSMLSTSPNFDDNGKLTNDDDDDDDDNDKWDDDDVTDAEIKARDIHDDDVDENVPDAA